MYFDEKFLKSLPEDSPSAIAAICDYYDSIEDNLSKDEDENENQQTLIKEAFGLIAAYSEANDLGIDVPPITGDFDEDYSNANDFFQEMQKYSSQGINQSEFEQYKNIYAARLGKVFHFEFSEGDLGLIQNLINELRELISTTEELEEDHRHRLIKKLEKVQSELHKRVSNLDRFWGFCIDLSIVVGLMGENAKPTVDLVKKIVAIIWPAQTRAYELPSSLPFKLLGQVEDDKSENGKS